MVWHEFFVDTWSQNPTHNNSELMIAFLRASLINHIVGAIANGRRRKIPTFISCAQHRHPIQLGFRNWGLGSAVGCREEVGGRRGGEEGLPRECRPYPLVRPCFQPDSRDGRLLNEVILVVAHGSAPIL